MARRDKFSSMRNTDDPFGAKNSGLGGRKGLGKQKKQSAVQQPYSGEKLSPSGPDIPGRINPHKGKIVGYERDMIYRADGDYSQNTRNIYQTPDGRVVGPNGAQIPEEAIDPDGRIPHERVQELEARIEQLETENKKINLFSGRLSLIESRLTGGDPFFQPKMPRLEEGSGITITQYPNRIRFDVKRDIEAQSGNTLDGFEIYLADGTRFEVTDAQAMTGYDSSVHNDWSLEFDVSSSALADYAESGTPAVMTNPLGVSTVNEPVAGKELLHDADASASPSPVAQSYYRIPIIRDGKRVCYGGAYRANHIVDGSRGPVVELIRI